MLSLSRPSEPVVCGSSFACLRADPHGLVQRQQFPVVAGIQHKIHDDLFELDGIDARASGLWLKLYDRPNLFTDHSLQDVQDDILVLPDKFLMHNRLVNSKWHDDQKSIFGALVLGISYDRADAEQIRPNMGHSLGIEIHLRNWSGLTIDS